MSLIDIEQIILSAICLLLSIGIAFYHYFTDLENRDYQLLSKSKFEVFRFRRYLWLQQTCFILSSFFLVITYYNRVPTLSNVITSFLEFFTVLLSLIFDTIKDLKRLDRKKRWLPLYYLLGINAFLRLIFLPFCVPSLITCLLYISSSLFALKVVKANPEYRQIRKLPEEYTCGLFRYLTFSHINDIIQTAMKKRTLDIDDIPTLADVDSCQSVWKKFRPFLRSSSVGNYSSMILSLFRVIKYEWVIQSFFQWLSSSSLYLAPLALERIIMHVSETNNQFDDGQSNSGGERYGIERYISLHMAVLMLFLGPSLKCIGDGQNYMRGRYLLL